MGVVVDAAKSPGVDVRVHLCRRERAVTEQLLDGAQVGAALEQVRGKRVPEAVRMGSEAAERARVQPSAPRRQEEGVLGSARQAWARIPQIAR